MQTKLHRFALLRDRNLTLSVCFAGTAIISILDYMRYIVAGLGNPGEEYAYTRHNIGRLVVERLASTLGVSSEWRTEAKLRAQVVEPVLRDGTKAVLVLPDNYMNRSGGSVAPYITSKKSAEQLVVVHDDIDLPFGTLRIVFNRGSGGHRGVDSIVKAIKTSAFIRVRVGVLSTTPSGKMKKPHGEGEVHTFILKPLSKKDKEAYEPYIEHAAQAVRSLLEQGIEQAMRDYNGVMGARVAHKRSRSAKRS
jgi:PTH1 family peptidyl-tRNA hydrolase